MKTTMMTRAQRAQQLSVAKPTAEQRANRITFIRALRSGQYQKCEGAFIRKRGMSDEQRCAYGVAFAVFGTESVDAIDQLLGMEPDRAMWSMANVNDWRVDAEDACWSGQMMVAERYAPGDWTPVINLVDAMIHQSMQTMESEDGQ